MNLEKHEMPVWVLAGLAHLGTREKKRGDSGAIQLFYALSGNPQIRNDEVAWCAAFVGACLERVGIRSTRSLMAKSYSKFGAHCQMRAGAIAVFDRGKDPAFGHVGFVYDWNETHVWLLNGNVGDKVVISKRVRSGIKALRWPSEEPAAMPAFDAALSFVAGGPEWVAEPKHNPTWGVEGGWSDDPDDPGGATFRGVTIGRLRQWRGRAVSKADLRALSFAEIRAIYLTHYWFEGWCDQLPAPMNLAHFDATVNHGRGISAPFLQKSVGAVDDGDIGPNTLKAVRSSDTSAISRYLKLRETRYRTRPHFWRFGRGWLNRLEKLASALDSVRNLGETPVATPAKSKTEMSENIPTMPEPPKWWLHSKTVWGALIASASFYLPIIATFAGYPITAADIKLVGELGMNVLTALGQIIGFALVVYGRASASGPIGSRAVTFRL